MRTKTMATGPVFVGRDYHTASAQVCAGGRVEGRKAGEEKAQNTAGPQCDDALV